MSSFDDSVVDLSILEIPGRPVTAIPKGGNVDFIDAAVSAGVKDRAQDEAEIARWRA